MAKRNRNREGCVYQTKDGKWKASIMIGTKRDGKPVRKSFNADTEAEARKKLRQYQKQLKSNEGKSRIIVTVEDYFENEFLPYKKRFLKLSSYRRMESTYLTHIKKELGTFHFEKLTTKLIQKFIDSSMSKQSYSSTKKIYDLINACCKYNLAQPPEERILSYNPCDLVIIDRKSLESGMEPVKIFYDDELIRIKEELSYVDPETGVPRYPYGPIYILILNTGIRMGELAALDKHDILWSIRKIRINKNAVMCKDPDGTGYQMVIQSSTKTKNGTRTVPLNEAAMHALLTLEERFPDTEYLALNQSKQRITPNNIEKTFAHVLDRCEIERNGRNCHALRHTFATTLFRTNVDIKTISQILGHGSIRITYDTYISVCDEQMENVMDRIPEI